MTKLLLVDSIRPAAAGSRVEPRGQRALLRLIYLRSDDAAKRRQFSENVEFRECIRARMTAK